MDKVGFIIRQLDDDDTFGRYVRRIDKHDGTFFYTDDVVDALVFDAPSQVIAAVQRRNASLTSTSLGRFTVEKVVFSYEATMEALIDCDEGVIAFNVPMVLESEEEINPMTIEDLVELLIEKEKAYNDEDEALFGDDGDELL